MCDVCKHKKYKLNLCKSCYKNEKKNTFHCTHTNCLSPVFAMTLCQKHYRIWKVPCLLCSKKIYCKSVCRSHYMQYLKKEIEINEPLCKLCNKKVYINNICLNHFKENYNYCIIINCKNKSHKRGLCCSHYFNLRRKGII